MRWTHLPVTLNGMRAPLSKWIKDSGLRTPTVINRLRRGRTPLEALTTPDREGHRLLPEVDPAQLSSPCTPIVTIGTVSKSLAAWSDLAGLPSESITLAVNGGIAPLDALTKWCGPQHVFWTRFWEEQMQKYEEQHAASAFVLHDAVSIKPLLLLARQDGRVDPLEYYCRQQCRWDDTTLAKYYANTTVGWCTMISGSPMNEADDGIIRLFEALRPAVTQLRDSLTTALNEFVPDCGEEHEWDVGVALNQQISHYIYRALKANVADETAAPLEEVMVEQMCDA